MLRRTNQKRIRANRAPKTIRARQFRRRVFEAYSSNRENRRCTIERAFVSIQFLLSV